MIVLYRNIKEITKNKNMEVLLITQFSFPLKKFGWFLTGQWPYHCLTDRVIFFLSAFWSGPPVPIPWSHRLGFLSFFFSNTFSIQNISDHTTVSQTRFKKTRSMRSWYGHWRPGVKCLRKKPRSDRLWYGHWGLLNLYSHWWVKFLGMLKPNLKSKLLL